MSEEADLLKQIRRELAEIKQALGQPLVGEKQSGGGAASQEWSEQISLLREILKTLQVLQQEFHLMFYHRDAISKKNNLAHAIWALKEQLAGK